MTRAGYIKRAPVSTYRAQRRGGRGRRGAAVRDEDPVEHLFVASTHDVAAGLHLGGQGVLAQGARGPGGEPVGARQGDRQPAAGDPGREGRRPGGGQGVRRRALPPLRDAPRQGQEDRARRRTPTRARPGSSRSRSRRATTCSTCASPTARATSSSAPTTAWGSASRRADVRPMGRVAAGVRGISLRERRLRRGHGGVPGRRPGRHPGRRRARLRQAHAGRGVPRAGARRQGDHAHEGHVADRQRRRDAPRRRATRTSCWSPRRA